MVNIPPQFGCNVRRSPNYVSYTVEYHPYIDVATAPATEVFLVNVLSLGREISDTQTAAFMEETDGLVVTVGSSRIKITREGCSLL